MDKLTKDKYTARKERNVTDADILKEFRMGSNTLRKYKQDWGLIDSSKKQIVDTKNPADPIAQATAPSTLPTSDDHSMARVYVPAEWVQVKEELKKLQAENDLLKSLLKHYL